MSRSYTSSPPQVPPWRVAGLLYVLPGIHLIGLRLQGGGSQAFAYTGRYNTERHTFMPQGFEPTFTTLEKSKTCSLNCMTLCDWQSVSVRYVTVLPSSCCVGKLKRKRAGNIKFYEVIFSLILF
jgi:hypothetical protein